MAWSAGSPGNNLGSGFMHGATETYSDPNAGASITGYYNDQMQKRQLANDRGLRDAGLADAQIGIQPGMQANQFKQDRFNSVFPWLQSQLSGIGGQLATAGGQSGPSPEISVGGVWNPQQTQQQVNAARAKNDQSAQTTMRTNAQSLGAQGFGSNSPLLASMNNQTQAGNLAANSAAEMGLRTGMAKDNAASVLDTQTARENQFASRQKEDIARRAPVYQMYNTLLSSLSGLV